MKPLSHFSFQRCALILCLSCCSQSWAQPIKTDATDANADRPQRLQHIIDHVPSLIDASPTLLPPQSDQAMVPKVAETQDKTWADSKQSRLHNWVDQTAHRMDNWFGTPDPNKAAYASLRVIIDQSYNKYDDYEFKPRVLGKIKLPTLQRKVSMVFGDDALDNELGSSVAIENKNPSHRQDKQFDAKRSRDENASIALRWSSFSKSLAFDLDADLGIRSTDDVYVRLKAKKDWPLSNDFNIHAEQIYRYGLKSENYLRTNIELTHARPQQAFISSQLSLTYADKQENDLNWDNHLFRQHQFFQNNRFNYGLYTGGFYHKQDLRLNSWGPFVSWRQPLWREWFYVQGDLNYFNQHQEQRSHYLSTIIRLEALF